MQHVDVTSMVWHPLSLWHWHCSPCVTLLLRVSKLYIRISNSSSSIQMASQQGFLQDQIIASHTCFGGCLITWNGLQTHMWHNLRSLLGHNWQYLWFWKTFLLLLNFLSVHPYISIHPQQYLSIQMTGGRVSVLRYASQTLLLGKAYLSTFYLCDTSGWYMWHVTVPQLSTTPSPSSCPGRTPVRTSSLLCATATNSRHGWRGSPFKLQRWVRHGYSRRQHLCWLGQSCV